MLYQYIELSILSYRYIKIFFTVSISIIIILHREENHWKNKMESSKIQKKRQMIEKMNGVIIMVHPESH